MRRVRKVIEGRRGDRIWKWCMKLAMLDHHIQKDRFGTCVCWPIIGKLSVFH